MYFILRYLTQPFVAGFLEFSMITQLNQATLFSRVYEIKIISSGSLSGIAFWFQMKIGKNHEGEEVELDTSDDSNHYCQAIHLLDEPISVSEGDLAHILVALDETSGVFCKFVKLDTNFSSTSF